MFEAPLGAGDVLRLIRAQRATTRNALSLRTGLSRSTLAERVHALLTLGLVNEANGPSTGGRPPATLEFNPTAGVVLAASLHADFCRVVVCDLAAASLLEHTFTLDATLPRDAALAAVRAGLSEALALAGTGPEQLWGVGIGVQTPVGITVDGTTDGQPQSNWDERTVSRELPDFHGAPVLVDRHVNLLGLAEHWTHWRAVDHLLYVSVGTSIECAIVSYGTVHRGARGVAGGLGHIGVPGHDDAVCACGNTGCLEAVVGGQALATQLRAAGLRARTPADVARLARAGAVPAVQAVRAAGRALGEVLADCVNFYNPGAIVLGGELAEASQHLLAGVRETAFARSLPMATRDLAVKPALLGEGGATTGAAVMVIEHVLAPESVDQAVQRDNGH